MPRQHGTRRGIALLCLPLWPRRRGGQRLRWATRARTSASLTEQVAALCLAGGAHRRRRVYCAGTCAGAGASASALDCPYKANDHFQFRPGWARKLAEPFRNPQHPDRPACPLQGLSPTFCSSASGRLVRARPLLYRVGDTRAVVAGPVSGGDSYVPARRACYTKVVTVTVLGGRLRGVLHPP